MQAANFEEVLERIIAADPRYHRDAYYFVREGLDYTQKRLSKGKLKEPHHVTGGQLLEGLRNLCLEQFGPMAFMVLQEWGLHRSEDFGEIVFNMVEHNFLAKTETDTRTDFQRGYDFFETFSVPFLPASKRFQAAASPRAPGGVVAPPGPPPSQA